MLLIRVAVAVRVPQMLVFRLMLLASSVLLQVDQGNHALRRINLTSGMVTTLAGNYGLRTGPPTNYGRADGTGTAVSFYYPWGVAIGSSGTFAIIVSSIV